MSEPKTIRDVLEPRWPLVPHDVIVREAWRDAWGRMKDSGVLDYHIIPGANAVVTPQGLDDAARAACGVELLDDGYDTLPESMKDVERARARKALEAAGIEVVDEAVEVKNEEGHVQYTAHKDDGEYSYVGLEPGDRVYIKRGENTNDQG